MPTRVKICGVTRAQDAALAVELGASALGFNFYPRSPRSIAPEAAWEIIRSVPPPVMTVGVFANESEIDHVLGVAYEAGVSAIQLHGAGAGSPRGVAAQASPMGKNVGTTAASARDEGQPPGSPLHRYPVIRALTVDDGFEPESLRSLEASVFLLDAPHPVLKGGTGQTIDWAKARAATHYGRVILAGGLTPENVAEAIRQVRPFAVDVASGVEASPGVKDEGKLRAFFAAVREADET